MTGEPRIAPRFLALTNECKERPFKSGRRLEEEHCMREGAGRNYSVS